MKLISLLTVVVCMLFAHPGWAVGPDDFVGDTAIYGGETASVKPNVLIIFDTSGSMDQDANVKVCVPDYDDDDIPDTEDNCPLVANHDQADSDGDGVGDVCDLTPCPDQDGDGFPDIDDVALCGNPKDNCPAISNVDQTDQDGDGVGDACDNCPTVANSTQRSTIVSGVGDACVSNTSGAYDPDNTYSSSTNYCGVQDGHYEYYNHHLHYVYDDSYSNACQKDAVYYCSESDWDNGVCHNWQSINSDVDTLNDQCTSSNGHHDLPDETIETALKTTGFYIGNYYFNSSNECRYSNNNTGHFATGNWINWYNITNNGTASTWLPDPAPVQLLSDWLAPPALQTARVNSIEVAAKAPYPVASALQTSSWLPDLAPGLLLDGQPAPPAAQTSATSSAATPGQVCTLASVQPSKNDVARSVVEDLIRSTAGVNFGVMTFYRDSHNTISTDGGQFVTGSNGYTTYIKDMTETFSGSLTNEDALLAVVDGLPAETYTPLAKTLYEAKQYFIGGSSAFHSGLTYTSPIQASCQQNYVIIITDGMANQDGSTSQFSWTSLCSSIGGCDNDGDNLDDVAKYLYTHDLSDTYAGTQNAKTYTIGFNLQSSDADAIQLLQDTADQGHGVAYQADGYQSLTGALTSIIGQILEVNSAFVAPVVPTSPENRSYSGKRVYLGFFKPVQNTNWKGNLKKYGLNDSNEIVDKNGVVATDPNGNFLPTATSFWSTSPDGENVDMGGVGEELITRADPRIIYTYTGTSNDLTNSSNSFSNSNTALPALLGASDTDSAKIVNYVYGKDAWDEDVDGNTTEVRGSATDNDGWILGDILHSRPLIQPYNRYSLDDEDDPAKNLSVIYVGSNDGQLHAFSDATGDELWSFIPPSVLPGLHYLNDNIHQYFNDGSPTMWTYDHDKDGNIGTVAEAGDGDLDDGSQDKAILLFGMRRGGGIDHLTAGSRGAYYALDVTNPSSPKYLWKIDNQTTGFSELGETWSNPVVGKMRLNGEVKIVAFIGAGYDNNEDLRYGNQQQFPDDTDDTLDTAGPENIGANEATSVGTSAQYQPKGRGIYLIELAKISSTGTVTVNSSPTLLWSWVYTAARESSDSANNPHYSFPSGIAAIDTNFDGYIDTLYCGDTGGNLWRFKVGSKTSTSDWAGTKIFSANPSDTTVSDENPATNGRKIFYAPSVVLESGYNGVFFGTGDRPHALNTSVTNRMYAVFDRGQSSPVTEANMVNVTDDILQADTSAGRVTQQNISDQLQDLSSTDKYGWFIKLNSASFPGEKVLSSALVYNKVAYFTTFSPQMLTESEDPCQTGNLGAGRTFALNYLTGEAVFNYDKTNDGSDTTNTRATTSTDGVILRRSDRVLYIGTGIPSGVVLVVSDGGGNGTGKAFTLVGSGGGVMTGEAVSGGTLQQVYWMQN